ncbi:MBL fold metallo-hydrolase [Archaeoglobus neptunius]|uniref:MBL fold metallo-hydrolase n=1 Tax=Archaeoglobus neptunius TaxID=2798580 RepID=UPI001928CC2A|nr:MBL fold metallo-hydrolase [Archaeoglobus neptunius]
MEVVPVAYDSMGVRSMATFVRTSDVTVLIDPGVSLAPKRYSLPPHRVEIERMNQKWDEIRRFLAESDLVVITHYHYDHHDPNDVEVLNGKKLLIKHPKEKINRSQMGRAAYFLEQLKNLDVEVEFCDGKNYSVGETLLEFSKPVFHGADSRLGFVVEVYVDDGRESFLFSSDVEGPNREEQLDFMLEKNAETVIVDGPMTYMLGYRFSQKSFHSSVENLKTLIERSSVRKLVLDHHLTRDLRWRERMVEVFEFGRQVGVEVLSAAEMAGVKEDLLEARRKELYKKKN